MTDASLTSEPEKLLPEGIALEDVTPTIAAAFADNACLIYSGEHRLYWRANAHGYTSEATRAGRYTIGDAYERTRHCDPDKQIRFVRLSSPVSGTDGSLRDSVAYVIDDPMMLTETKADQIIAMLSASPSTPIPVIAEAGEREAQGWDHRYRPLAWGEVILPTDECRGDDGTWVTGICVGEKAPDPAYTSHRVYRRLISTPATLDNTAVEGLLDKRPTVAEAAFGPEPSLRELVRHYYGQHYHDEGEADRHTATYIATLTAKTEKAE